MSLSRIKTAEAFLLIIVVLSSGVTLSGCLGSPAEDVTPEPTAEAIAITDQPDMPVSGSAATTVPAPIIPEPAVTRTGSGYLLKDTPGAEDTVQVHLKAGKASFHIRLADYSTGDSYTLTLANAEGPFTYRSSHELRGITGADDIRLVKTIPQDGTYQVSLDYGDHWEIEITQ